jgi:hypothetical protein
MGNFYLLKIKLFWTFHMHSIAHTPTRVWPLSFLATPFNQLSNNLWYFKRCNIECDEHNVPNHFIKGASNSKMLDYLILITKVTFNTSMAITLAKLTFARMTFMWRNHMNILIFKGTFIFQCISWDIQNAS